MAKTLGSMQLCLQSLEGQIAEKTDSLVRLSAAVDQAALPDRCPCASSASLAQKVPDLQPLAPPFFGLERAIIKLDAMQQKAEKLRQQLELDRASAASSNSNRTMSSITARGAAALAPTSLATAWPCAGSVQTASIPLAWYELQSRRPSQRPSLLSYQSGLAPLPGRMASCRAQGWRDLAFQAGPSLTGFIRCVQYWLCAVCAPGRLSLGTAASAHP